jgi:hypothetical protein
VRVTALAGVPLPAATVTVRDRVGAVVLSGVTGLDGVVAGTLTTHAITSGPTVDARGPFTVEVGKAGVGVYSGSHAVTSRTAVVVDLVAGTAALDATPPSAPANLLAIPLSASRLLLRWSASADASGVAGYLVEMDGALAAVTDAANATVTGLAAGSAHSFSVRAVDRGGNVSAAASVGSVATRPEDRGP